MVLTEEQKARKNEYNKEYRQKNKEKQKEYMKEYRQKNKQKMEEREKEYRQKNKEKIAEKKKEYHQTEKSKKEKRITHWKERGVVGDYEELYDKYINTDKCEICKSVFTNTFDRCLDHDHDTGEFRNILCRGCNSFDNWKKTKIKD